jgi:undecaprenyl diphosphate synthase
MPDLTAHSRQAFTTVDTISSGSANSIADIPRSKYPKHIAMIMDGNGRWARQRSKPRIEGHQQGTGVVRQMAEESARLGLEQLTLYCLSSENWKRPKEELDFLLHLLQQYMINERETLMDNQLVMKVIGRRERLPDSVQAEMNKTIEMTANNTGTTLCLAINYGSRNEIVDAIKLIAAKVQRGEISIDQIDEDMVGKHLYTAGMPDPDLLIRTAGELRVSNYLLWQISYAELWVTDKYWPEFEIADLHQSIVDYANRERRFGGLNALN